MRCWTHRNPRGPWLPTLGVVPGTLLRSRPTRYLAALVVLVVGVVVAGVPILVRPQLDPVTRADAVVVLGGSNIDGRVETGLQLVRDGVAGQLVLSNPYASPDTVTGRACRSTVPGVEISCFPPDPSTTQGEAEEIARLADARGWRSVVVVTAVYHVSRARWIIQGCYDGRLTMVAPESRPGLGYWAYQYAYQVAGYTKAAIIGRCR